MRADDADCVAWVIYDGIICLTFVYSALVCRDAVDDMGRRSTGTVVIEPYAKFAVGYWHA